MRGADEAWEKKIIQLAYFFDYFKAAWEKQSLVQVASPTWLGDKWLP